VKINDPSSFITFELAVAEKVFVYIIEQLTYVLTNDK